MVRSVLAELHGDFAKLYSSEGRPSIPPEQLLSALLLQAFYGIRSETAVDGAARLQSALPLVCGAWSRWPGLATTGRRRKPFLLLKKLRRRTGGDSSPSAARHPSRDVVAGRGTRRPKDRDHPAMGQAGNSALGAERPAHRVSYIFGAICPAEGKAAGIVLPMAGFYTAALSTSALHWAACHRPPQVTALC